MTTLTLFTEYTNALLLHSTSVTFGKTGPIPEFAYVIEFKIANDDYTIYITQDGIVSLVFEENGIDFEVESPSEMLKLLQ